jgi:hypothetical protein
MLKKRAVGRRGLVATAVVMLLGAAVTTVTVSTPASATFINDDVSLQNLRPVDAS